MSQAVEQRNQDATLHIGNLDPRVDEELIWELFTQAAPVDSVYLPRDKVTGSHFGYGFVEFRVEQDAEYAMRVMSFVKIFKSPLKVSKSSLDRKRVDIGANLFIGGLDEMVDEKLLHDTFSAFGTITQPPMVKRDDEVGRSRGFGFVSYDSFEAADLAIQCMDGQFLASKQIKVQYAFKKESRGERHGSEAERLLAKEMRAKQRQGPHAAPNLRFAAAPPPLPPRGLLSPPHMQAPYMGMVHAPPLGPPPHLGFAPGLAPPPLPPRGPPFAGMGRPPPGMPPGFVPRG